MSKFSSNAVTCLCSRDNLTAVLYGTNNLKLEQRPIPIPKDNQVLLRMESIGICGSDVHYWLHGRIGDFILTDPMIIGHEASGTVIYSGKNCKKLEPGDRVAIEPGVPCRLCDFCKVGKYNLCPDMKFCATPPNDGNLTRFYCHDGDFCYKLPDNIDLDEGALMEPLSVGVHACKLANVKVGDNVLILGSGPIGLATLLVAKAFGAAKCLITDIVDEKLEKATEVGADFTLKVGKCPPDDLLVREIIEKMECYPNVTIDCVGNEQCLRVAIKATKTGGQIILVGLAQDERKIPTNEIISRELTIKGSFRYCNDYPTAIDLVKSEKVNVQPLITNHYKLEDAIKAFQCAKAAKGHTVKILIHANPDWVPNKCECIGRPKS